MLSVAGGLFVAAAWRGGFNQDTTTGVANATFGDLRFALGYAHPVGPIDLGAAFELRAPTLLRADPALVLAQSEEIKTRYSKIFGV